MAAEEDNFEIDVYGEGDREDAVPGDDDYYEEEEHTFTVDEPDPPPLTRFESNQDSKHASIDDPPNTSISSIPSENHSARRDSIPIHPRNVKRKGPPNDHSSDSGATSALLISDLHWWITEDDLRDWVNQAGAEDDLKEITFNEHKVNGKSKGQVYLDFNSSPSSSAAKNKIEALTEGPNNTRKFVITFTNPSHNPFKTLPKDAPARAKEERSSRGGSGAYSMGRGDFRDSPGYRGRGRGYDRGGYDRGGHDRGGYGNQGYNRNFSGSGGGYNNQTFQNNMGMMNNFGFNRGAMSNNGRGNMGGTRGGRGGMNNMMPMAGMMGMNPMMTGMGMPGFQAGQFGPGMFNPGPSMNFGGDWNQPGAKRQRQE